MRKTVSYSIVCDPDRSMAISVDMDNMEAALFSSFSSKQQGKRGRKRAQEPEKVDNDMSLHKEDRKDEKIISNMKTNAKESRVKPRTFGKLIF